jgi:N-formylglutamate deformylase
MTPVFDYHGGSSPLLISVPHDGRQIPPDITARMTPQGRGIPDTDWHVNRLYDFAARLHASVLSANFSRYVVDLNRPAADEDLYPGQVATGLCPHLTFAGEPIYDSGGVVGDEEKQNRVEKYWQPYHDQLAASLQQLKATHGFALLWDAHSIRGEVPMLFDGCLPDLNIGTNNGVSCVDDLAAAVVDVAGNSQLSMVFNGRFRGGHITRHFGSPQQGIHAIQLELVQHCYMDESTRRYDIERAGATAAVIEGMLAAFVKSAKSLF